MVLPSGSNHLGSVTIDGAIAYGVKSAPVGVSIGTAAALVLAANANRHMVIIQNQSSTANLWLGRDNTVTTSGATVGTRLGPGMTLTDTLTGDAWWGISDAAGTLVSVQEVT
jgi:hypothetical protein